MLNLGKVYGDKPGLGYVNEKITLSPIKTTFVKAIPPRVSLMQGDSSNILKKKTHPRQPQANQGKLAKVTSKQSKSRDNSTQPLLNQSKPRHPIIKGQVLKKDSSSSTKKNIKRMGINRSKQWEIIILNLLLFIIIVVQMPH
ncbi:hypothetical protein ACOSP7_026766 [Xanthoceras sorbifolium]